MLKPNEGMFDRVVRVSLGLVLLGAGLLLGALQGNAVGLVLGGIAVLPLVTGIVGICPLYLPFGISTVGLDRKLMRRCMSRMAGNGQCGCGYMAGMGGPSSRTGQTGHSATM